MPFLKLHAVCDEPSRARGTAGWLHVVLRSEAGSVDDVLHNQKEETSTCGEVCMIPCQSLECKTREGCAWHQTCPGSKTANLRCGAYGGRSGGFSCDSEHSD
eukprot:1934789-Amphidinium_carterae.2